MNAHYTSSTSHSPQQKRRPSLAYNTATREKARLSPLPSYVDLVEQKQLLVHRNHGWTTTLYIPSPLPAFITRRPSGSSSSSGSASPPPRPRFRITLPIPPRLWTFAATALRTVSRTFRRRRLSSVVLLVLLAVLWLVYTASKKLDFENVEQQWYGDPPTLVYSKEDLRKVWLWEIASGHYPSSRKIPNQVGVPAKYANPGLPSRPTPPRKPSPDARPGTGFVRTYPDVRAVPPNVAYPPRPPPGSIADLDVVMDYCDFSTHKYVRDCLEVLRLGGGLDNKQRVRRAKLDEWRYIYTETDNTTSSSAMHHGDRKLHKREEGEDGGEGDLEESLSYESLIEATTDGGSSLPRHGALEPHLDLPPPLPPHPPSTLYPPSDPAFDACDPDHPRLYHMFWAGPFTDKPYLALLSFLFTQNLGLHLTPEAAADHFRSERTCRPEFWLWINPGAAAAVPSATAEQDMLASLRANPWSSPFLHERFEDVIKFKLWNTTEQLDGVPELRHEWRSSVDTLFNSGGVKYSHPKAGEGGEEDGGSEQHSDDDLFNRLGSESQSSYDRLSVVLSDMARFVLCHRFGGTYLDADTILLRDWEELWGWKGAFAYRWSRLEKYNTAVLRMNKGSALGTFLFRTALRNGLDFHPMTVSRYTKDAHLEGLLLRLPDALFDPAWLNTEKFQRDRPPFPYFTEFQDFFDTPTVSSGGPQALGFDGFFKGSYSYHFHNFWWIPFDPSRNWPDLGARFSNGERIARLKARAKPKLAHVDSDPRVAPPRTAGPGEDGYEEDAKGLDEDDRLSDDARDLAWATVLKRTFESYLRGERPNMYGEWILW